MDLSVIIVNWNTKDLLARCLQSLCETAGELPFEVWVVDNASVDGSVAMIQENFPGVQVIENTENVGFARANNQAIPASLGRYVLLLNSDTELKAKALYSMIAFLNTNSQAGAVGPKLLNSDGSLQSSCHPMLTPWREFWRLLFLERVVRRATYDMHDWGPDTPREVEVIKGACLMLRREALDQVGLLDPLYFMYTEEVDLCYRLRQAGWELYWLPNALVVHHGEGSSHQVAEAMYVQLYRSKVQFFRKTGGQAQAYLFKILVALAYMPRFLAAAVATPLAPNLMPRARTFHRLLAELTKM